MTPAPSQSRLFEDGEEIKPRRHEGHEEERERIRRFFSIP
jgi:hypothetical protein